MTAVIEFRGLSKSYGSEQVIRELSLAVQPGEFFALIGVNGAGKTTSIKCMLDFCDVSSGEISLFGLSHTDKQARRRLAYLPERFIPPYYLKGVDFLRYTCQLYQVAFQEDGLAELCAQVDLNPEALDKAVHDLSKGMAQKLGILAILMSGTELYVLDEPMSGLDPRARAQFKRCLKSRKESGLSLFFSTHMLADVEVLCDRMAILHEGELRFMGSPAECLAKYGTPTLEDAYLACVSAT